MLKTELQLLNCFPKGFEPNNAQKYILHEIAVALDSGKKFIILNAPTATGKSFISKTIANYSSAPSDEFVESVNNYSAFESNEELKPFGTAILTVTKNLQEQYAEMFEDGAVLKGRSNYPCEINEDTNCEHGNCIFFAQQKKKCLANNICPYYNARNNAVANKCSFYNYSMFNKLPDSVKHKEFIICDEASELEQELVGQYTFEVRLSDLMKIDPNMSVSPGIDSNKNEYLKWLKSIQAVCESEYNDLIKILSKSKRKKLKKQEAERFNLLLQYKETAKQIRDTWYETKYIIKHDNGAIIFQPYNVDNLSNHIFMYGKTIILMSATIVDHQSFANTLGIKDYHYIEAQMTLEAEKAPIKVLNQFSLNYRNKDQVLPLMCGVVEYICNQHKNQKGIIHTHSMEILGYIKRYCKDQSRFLFRQEGMTNEQLLEIHKNTSEPTILVSPSMTHGVDLKGKLGEFQIIMKAPYLPIGDDRIKMKFTYDKTWYNNAMLSTLIQMCGRCNRLADDYSVTYILDSNVLRAVKQNVKKLPSYFLDRFA